MTVSTESLLKAANDIKDAYNSYIVRPANAFGLGGFVFDVEMSSTATLSSDITDHYTERNAPIQDHIALKPKRYVLTTYVGELVHRRDEEGNTPTQNMVRKLNIVNAYLPVLTDAAQQALDIINSDREDIRFSGLVNDAANIWSAVKNLNPPIPEQQKAYMYFKALWETKQLVSLQTPFEFMANMAIETISATQSEDSRWVSDFTITLKEIRYASTENVQFEYIKQLDGIAGEQRADEENNGATQGRDASILREMAEGSDLLKTFL